MFAVCGPGVGGGGSGGAGLLVLVVVGAFMCSRYAGLHTGPAQSESDAPEGCR